MSGRRVVVAASEVLGMDGTGGAATADSLLALALARYGHEVDLLVAPGRSAGELAEPWKSLYADLGVRVTHLEPSKRVFPSYLAPSYSVFETARAIKPDVLVADDWRGLAWATLRARQLGLEPERTAVILYCHGPARMLAEFARKVPDTVARYGEEIAERAALELADAAVSPSAWLFAWERERGWPAARNELVVPCLWRSVALGEEPVRAEGRARVTRLAFFGQLREGKGVRIFLDALAQLGPVVENIDLLFLGRETPRWTTERIRAALPRETQAHLRSLRFETGLDPIAALAELRVPGTLAVMPSLLDNSPYTVSECLEHGVPFLAARTGGIPELVAEEDHARTLFDPTADDLARALRSALTAADGVGPATPGFDPRAALVRWVELVETIEPIPRARGPRISAVSVVAAPSYPSRTPIGAVDLTLEHIESDTRAAGLARASHDWVVFVDRDDDPDAGLLDALVEAQALTGADAVTTAVRPADTPDGVRVFLGDPGALGLVENQYGVIALVRRALLTDEELAPSTSDPDWPLLAGIALRGGQIVSLPIAFATHRGRPGTISDVPGEGLAVLRLFETRGHDSPGIAALAATLAAALARSEARESRQPPPSQGLFRRAASVVRNEGVPGLLVRVRARLPTRRFVGRRAKSLIDPLHE
ncbi:MAG: hypothetical protein KatS3mg012_0257 [Gaiellaceae bacterium]|nr:MAG: hypothetical protein KatS3mg012_0257 [Gaiellaceae bacterium]